MKAKIVAYYGYNYTDKNTGELKEGRSIDVIMTREFKQDDNKGNFSYGCNTQNNIRLSSEVMGQLTHLDLVSLIGQEVELVYEKAPGSRYESLVEIIPV